ncbi:MAG: phosphate starvation-inducible protein PhoH [Algoriphagus sp.]|uniref:PhoH family protein n=1 Tax=Algoriphagus sp. TaxID=1872435 RepID=UPI000C6AC716|nr:PhoH family protein [Algoriphagus sp.]MAL15821.1 phosphate starvation-inducible protein PhoH [Algoriphagus sp.]
MKKTYILDTNVFLTNSNSIFEYKNNDLIVPLKVLDEIDKHKKRQDSVGLNARSTIRVLDELRTKGNLHKGVRIDKGLGILSVRGYDYEDVPIGCDLTSADNQIITTALTEKKKYPKKKIIVVSRDINMRVKCDSLEVLAEDYIPEKIITDFSKLFTGFSTHLVDDQLIDRFYEGEKIYLDDEEHTFSPNQYIMLVSSANDKKTALAKFKSKNTHLGKIYEEKNGIWGLKPRNKEQMFALDLLMNPDIPIVTLIGKAGCGKTLLAIASGLQQVLDEEIYKKLVVTRPVQPLGKDIGYLPGTMEEKMRPWLMPIQDNIDFLLNGKKDNMSHFFDDGTIRIEALTYIRGRSISNAYIIVDEAQNLTTHELKTIITRVGENTKIILTGDVEQIDNVYLDATTNGLSYAIEKFKHHELAAHMSLIKGERSKVATLASKVL